MRGVLVGEQVKTVASRADDFKLRGAVLHEDGKFQAAVFFQIEEVERVGAGHIEALEEEEFAVAKGVGSVLQVGPAGVYEDELVFAWGCADAVVAHFLEFLIGKAFARSRRSVSAVIEAVSLPGDGAIFDVAQAVGQFFSGVEVEDFDGCPARLAELELKGQIAALGVKGRLTQDDAAVFGEEVGVEYDFFLGTAQLLAAAEDG